MSDAPPTWTEQVHQLACSLQPEGKHQAAWQPMPPAQDDAPLTLSLLLDQSLPRLRPSQWPNLIHHLARLESERWELLIPGPAPDWLGEWRQWLTGAIRSFPQWDPAQLQLQAKAHANGQWLLPVAWHTALAPELVERIESYACWSADTLLLHPGAGFARKRQALWAPSSNPRTLFVTTPVIKHAAAWFHPNERDQNGPQSDTNDGETIQLVINQRNQPVGVALPSAMAQSLGAPQADPITLLTRAEALGSPISVCSKASIERADRTLIPWSDLPAPTPWRPSMHAQRRGHGLLIQQPHGCPLPPQAKHWQQQGFTVLSRPNHTAINLDGLDLRWLTLLDRDCLIHSEDLDQLRDPTHPTMPLMRDRGSGLERTSRPNAEDPLGLTVPLPAGCLSIPSLPPPNTWQRCAHLTMAIEDPEPPAPAPPPPLSMRIMHQMQRWMKI